MMNKEDEDDVVIRLIQRDVRKLAANKQCIHLSQLRLQVVGTLKEEIEKYFPEGSLAM